MQWLARNDLEVKPVRNEIGACAQEEIHVSNVWHHNRGQMVQYNERI